MKREETHETPEPLPASEAVDDILVILEDVVRSTMSNEKRRIVEGYLAGLEGYIGYLEAFRSRSEADQIETRVQSLVSHLALRERSSTKRKSAAALQPSLVNPVEKPVEKAIHQSPPRFGELLLCLLIRSDRQQDRLGDLEEKFNGIWVPRFPLRVAKFIYIAQVLRTGITVAMAGAAMAVADRLWHVLSRRQTEPAFRYAVSPIHPQKREAGSCPSPTHPHA